MMDDSSDAAVAEQASCSKLLPHDKRDIENASACAETNEEKMHSLSSKFSKKGYLELIWDSKVPKQNKSFFNFISFSASKREIVLAEIEKYIDFYQEMRDAVQQVRTYGEAEMDSAEENPFTIIHDLSAKLSEMYAQAEMGQNFTASSTIHDLHSSFVKKHSQLERMVKKVECIAYKSGLRKATDGWQKSIDEVKETREEMRDYMGRYQNVSDEFNSFKRKTEKLSESNNLLLQKNTAMQEEQKQLMKKVEKTTGGWQKSIEEVKGVRKDMYDYMRKYHDVCDELKNVRCDTEKLTETNQLLLEGNIAMREDQKVLMEKMEDYENMAETNKLLLESNTAMCEDQKLLLEKMKDYEKMHQQQDVLLAENKAIQQKQDDIMDLVQTICKQQTMLLNRNPSLHDN